MNLCIYLHWGHDYYQSSQRMLRKTLNFAAVQRTAHLKNFMLIEIFSDESFGRAITTRLSRHAWIVGKSCDFITQS